MDGIKKSQLLRFVFGTNQSYHVLFIFMFQRINFLQCFIDVFYGENASRVLRVDMTMYTILAYLAVFRLEELGLSKFKELCATEEPSKISTFVAYLFNKVTI